VSIKIIDAAAHILSVSETADRVISYAPSVVGITVTTMVAGIAKAIARRIKEALPNTRIIAGGPHISGAGQDCLSQLNAFDVMVTGEGEQTFVELLEVFKDGGELADIAGVIFRDAKEEIHQTVERKRFDDLDLLPFPAWDLLDEFPAVYATNIFFSPQGPAASLITSRGCPFSCTFCDQSTFGHQYRAASAEYVYSMVKSLHENYKIRYIIFCDDNFTINRQRVLEICCLLERFAPSVSWSCDANVMTVDRQMLLAMKRAGCWSISYGLETGSSEVLKSLNKDITLERARDVISETRDAGIYAKGLFIMGTPAESLNTIKETQDFIADIPLSNINISKFTPYPGTELSKQVPSSLKADYERLNGMNFIVPSKYLTIQQLEEQYTLTIYKFYRTIGACKFHLPIIFGCWDNVRRLAGIVPDFMRGQIRRCFGVRNF
jgi:anaerobic magnesium-protoporphyrin IX monomethyl ester cyclase